ncbi:hypothetical protein, partial [Pseudomonas syringae group genomosp. 7]|uniref:hypothetical protein n=1 Tax=Pseudomonas syringae group genomosp. 7 TaxID=251699 RepID=UPI00376FA00E
IGTGLTVTRRCEKKFSTQVGYFDVCVVTVMRRAKSMRAQITERASLARMNTYGSPDQVS